MMNAAEFSKLFNKYHKNFILFANSYIRDLAVAEDYATEAWLYYWENRDRLPLDTNIPAYVLTIVKNKCLSHLRHQMVHEQAIMELYNTLRWEMGMRIARLEACEPHQIFTNEIQDMIRQAIQKLPGQTQTIFCMSRIEQIPQKEIAQQMGVSLKTVEFHMSKAIKILRKELRDYFPLLSYMILLHIIEK